MPTIGVAVAVPEPCGSHLQDYRTAIGDPLATQIPTHITLIPPTEVSEADLSVIREHLAVTAQRFEAFRLHLRGTGTFRPVTPVVFLTLVEGISQCELIADAVRKGPLAQDLPFPYHPHVTVAHNLDDERLDTAFAELSDYECEFEVDRFCLYVHREDAGWRPTDEFELTVGAGG